MPTLPPNGVRESWGQQAGGDVSRWLDVTLKPSVVPRDEHVDERLDKIERRIDAQGNPQPAH